MNIKDIQDFHVFCWVSSDEDSDVGDPGEYILATRQIFPYRKAAEAYAETIAPSRCPIILPRAAILRAAQEGRICSNEWILHRKS